MIFKKHQQNQGFSLVEILMSISLFSVAMIGLYFAFTSVASQTAQGLKGDVEAAYSKILIGEVDIFDLEVETAYDVTTKTAIVLPNGTTAYYTRDVRSEPTTPDVKEISVYFYKNSTDTDPYRNFTKEFAPKRWGYNMVQDTDTSATYRSPNGQSWTNIERQEYYDFSTAGSYIAGHDFAAQDNDNCGFVLQSTNSHNVSGSIDNSSNDDLKNYHWRTQHVGSTDFNNCVFVLPASQNIAYNVQIGFNEITAAFADIREMDITINGDLLDTAVDPFEETGGQFIALTKTYSNITPIEIAGGVYGIRINVSRTAAPNSDPRIAWIMLERAN